MVASVYNEELALPLFYKEIKYVLEKITWNYELIFVNDGSSDNSKEILQELANSDKKIKVINFSRNFGHEAAMTAGIDFSNSDAVICLDADLQHPPECIPRIIEKFKLGFDLINMVRTKNQDSGLLKKFTSKAFYKILNGMSDFKFEENASDFFAISSKLVKIFKSEFREKVRFVRGYIQCMGFKKTTIEYEANKRIAGESKYSIKKLLNFSINILFSFSDIPLKIGVFTGIFTALIGFSVMVYSLVVKVFFDVPSGYTTIIVVLCFMFALQFIIIGIIGEYISILFKEIKGRPIYIVEDIIENE